MGLLSGAFGASVKEQVSNVTGYFTENLSSVKQIAGGHAEFLQGGVRLLGVPVRAEART